MNVTVFGATGVVGRALVPLLAEHELTAVSRTARDEPGARWVVADAASGEGVAAALEGADVVYYLVHSLGARDFEEQDRAAAETVAREAANAGVRQIVYLGGLGADDPDASPHLRSRRETGERLASAGVPVTTLRAAMIVGKGSAAFETILGLVKRLPVMVTPSWVSTPTQPIALDDVARYLAGVCGNEAAYGEGYDAGRPTCSPSPDERPATTRRCRWTTSVSTGLRTVEHDYDQAFVVTLEYGPDHDQVDPFDITVARVAQDVVGQAHDAAYLHPVVRYHRDGHLVSTHHLAENLENQWDRPDVHVRPLREF